MNKAYLLIGGNMGNRLQNLGRSRERLGRYGTILQHSGLYETEAWGKTDQPPFLNQALLLHTTLSAPALLKAILAVEQEMGRVRTERYGPRTIDIDMLFYNNEAIALPNLQVPHPEIQNRRFALAPMQEIAPEFVHPVLKKTIEVLLAECPDKLEVKRITTE